MTLLNIILITLLFYSIFFFTKLKLKSTLSVWFNRTIIISYLFLLLFFINFIFVFRLLKFFQDNRSIDIKFFYQNYNIITLMLIMLLIIVIRKTIFHYTKICYFRLHYIWLSPVMNHKYYKFYTWFYLRFLIFFSKKYYDVIRYISILFTFILVITFIVDFFQNDKVLFLSLIYLKYFGLIKLFCIWLIFIATKLDVDKDFYVFSSLYPGDKSKNVFYLDNKYESIRRNEVEIINSYVVKTFYCIDSDYRKMINNWNKSRNR